MHFILHMGPAKTGTTAIQKWLLDQSDALRAQGVLYSPNGCGARGNFGALVKGLMGHRIHLKPGEPDRRRAGFVGDLEGFDGDTVLISAESFCDLLLTVDKGYFSGVLSPERVAAQAAKLKARLTEFGATRLTAVIALRSEGDRAVSRIAQSVQGFQRRPYKLTALPPALEDLLHPHDLFLHGLEAEGIEVRPLLYADPNDPRPLGVRILETANIPTQTVVEETAQVRDHVSPGVAGCIALMRIKEVIHELIPPKSERMRLACGRGRVCLQQSYADTLKTYEDAPFNGVGPERIAQVLDAQAKKTAVFVPHLGQAAIDSLNVSKWTGRPMSPLTVEDLSPKDRSGVAEIFDEFARNARALNQARKIYGDECLRVFDRLSDTVPQGAMQ